jgi:hypothetical protein
MNLRRNGFLILKRSLIVRAPIRTSRHHAHNGHTPPNMTVQQVRPRLGKATIDVELIVGHLDLEGVAGSVAFSVTWPASGLEEEPVRWPVRAR